MIYFRTLGMSCSSRGVAEHVYVISLRLEFIEINGLRVLPPMLDDLIDGEDLDASLLSILLDRDLVFVHANEELDAVGLALVLE